MSISGYTDFTYSMNPESSLFADMIVMGACPASASDLPFVPDAPQPFRLHIRIAARMR